MSDSTEKIKDMGYTNFKALSEEWSEYLLEDKSLLRIKTIPLKIISDGKVVALNSQDCLVTFSPKELKGTPSTEAINEVNVKKFMDKGDLQFETQKEPWNEYEFDDGTKMFLKMIAVQVSRTKLHDIYGDPVYWINHQLISKKYPI